MHIRLVCGRGGVSVYVLDDVTVVVNAVYALSVDLRPERRACLCWCAPALRIVPAIFFFCKFSLVVGMCGIAGSCRRRAGLPACCPPGR